MATQYTSYWLYQKYEKRGSQEAIPAYPNVWSVDGDGTMPKVVKTENDTACGYVPTGTTQYRWVNLPISQDFVCDECPAVEPMRRWEKSDQMICVEASAQYRWTNSGTTCVGYDKYQRAIKQVSYDSGVTWSNVSPAEYSATTLIEANSTDCGYVPPTPTGTKFYATYRDGRTYSAECDSDTTLYSTDTKPSGYAATAMTSAVIGNCITSIGYSAFYECSSLTSVVIPNSVTMISPYAFGKCYSLTNVNIPSGVTSIGQSAFSGCTSLTSIIIPDSVTSIERQAFVYCSGLTSINIGTGIATIGGTAFRYCTSLTSITINATIPPSLDDTYTLWNTNDCPIYVPASSVEAFKSASGWRNYADRIQAIP